MIARIEEIESAKDKLSGIPVSLKEEKFLSRIADSGGYGKGSWMDFDSYNKELIMIARMYGISHQEIVRLRRHNVVDALDDAFAHLPAEDAYNMFGKPRDVVLKAISNYNFRSAAAILEGNFDTTYL